jgi:predicted AAA+ superfamily ATPase
VSLNVYPLTFKEYLNFKGAVEKEKNETHFENFLENGGLPFTVSQLENDTQMIREYVSGVECDIIYKDIILKENISNPILFNRVKNFMYSSIGNYLSINNIRKQLLQSNLVIKNQLINKYISSLTDAFLFYKVERFDCVGKKILKIDPKYYVSDLSFRNINVPIPEENYGYLLENIVYFELLYRDYEVYVGQKNDLQIDFVVKKNFKKIYIQVCTQLNELNYSREIKNLKNISEPGCEMLFISKEKRDYYDELNVHHINIID